MTLASRCFAGLASLLLLAGAGAEPTPPPPQTLVDAAIKIVTRIKSDSKYAKELRTSRGLVVFPDAHPGSRGTPIPAILLKHDSDGLWSPPAFLTVTPLPSASPPSAKGGGGALLLMTEKAIDDFSRPRFTFALNDNLAVATFDSEKGQPLGEGDVELWSHALDGVSLVGVTFAQDQKLNRSYYGRPATTSDILHGQVPRKSATALLKILPL